MIDFAALISSTKAALDMAKSAKDVSDQHQANAAVIGVMEQLAEVHSKLADTQAEYQSLLEEVERLRAELDNLQGQQLLEGLVAAKVLDGIDVTHAQTQQLQVGLDDVAGRHPLRGEASIEAVDTGHLDTLADDREAGMAGEGTTTGAELDVGHGTLRVKGLWSYITMYVSGLGAFLECRVHGFRLQT